MHGGEIAPFRGDATDHPCRMGLPPEIAESTIMIVWVITDHPKDYPDEYVLRPQFAVRGEPNGRASRMAWTSPDLDELRELVCHLHRMPHQPGEDPVILETWI